MRRADWPLRPGTQGLHQRVGRANVRRSHRRTGVVPEGGCRFRSRHPGHIVRRICDFVGDGDVAAACRSDVRGTDRARREGKAKQPYEQEQENPPRRRRSTEPPRVTCSQLGVVMAMVAGV
jgi:hypothetical protein